ncbi:MAG: gliding motility-associated ABC transporter substrate-binding protein GldG [Flavobacteriales bacterium]
MVAPNTERKSKAIAGGSNRGRDLVSLLLGVGIVVLLNMAASFVNWRADLTSEKRFTLTEETEALMDSLPDKVFLRVYLAGELPADLQHLSNSTRELLDELRERSDGKLDYEFTDPNASPDKKTRDEVYEDLTKQGLKYSSLHTEEKGGRTEQIIFPGALLTYRNKTIPVQLLKTQYSVADPEMVNRSVNNLEYEMASAVRQATSTFKPRIAFLEGHGELDDLQVKDVSNALAELYDVGVARVRIDSQLNALSDKLEGAQYRTNNYDLLIVAKPDSVFNSKDQYVLDQFIMNGGKMLWLLDVMDPHLDSLRRNQFSIATPLELGLEDMLFSYGVRLNTDLLLDKSCAFISIPTTPYGDQRRMEALPFFYEPIITPGAGHPIVKNIEPLHFRFVGSMDTIANDSIRKTILLTTSPYTWLLRNPARVAMNRPDNAPPFERTTTPSLPVAVLLEGKFTSAFADRLSPDFKGNTEMRFREKGRRSAMLVVSDGDAIANRVDRTKGMYYTLGFDPTAQSKIFGNREFIINAVNYLLNDKSLISIRNRSVALRQLDPERSADDRSFWQVINVALPIGLSLAIGGLLHLLRRRRYAGS